MIFLRLSKEGYGHFLDIKYKWNAREVLNAIAYEKFTKDFEQVFLELNRP